MCKIDNVSDGVECPAVHIPGLRAHNKGIAADLGESVRQCVKSHSTFIICGHHNTAGFTEPEEPQGDVDRLVAFFADDHGYRRRALQAVLLDVPARPA